MADCNTQTIAQQLRTVGLELPTPDFDLTEALVWTAAHGHETALALLLDKGFSPDEVRAGSCTALQAAAYQGHDHIVLQLLEHGADVNAQGILGPALHTASRAGYYGIVRLLMDNGADINAQGGRWGTALQAASAGDHDQIAILLIDNGADVNARGGYYGSALAAATWYGHWAIVAVLLYHGADVEVHDLNVLNIRRRGDLGPSRP